nr:hypothetical protein [Tanacetum cinerariifolium]
MKARGTLLMTLPNKDQLMFHSYQDAKLLMEAIDKRGREYGRTTVPVETPIENALIPQDRIGGDKSKAGLGYKELIPKSFVNLSELLKKQNNRSTKGYHEVPPPLTGNYMPLKRYLRLIDEHFESETMDVSSVSSSADKTNKIVDITHKGVLSTDEPKSVMKNNFGPPIIEDWHSDDNSEDELSPTIEQTRPSNKLSSSKRSVFNKKVKTVRVNDSTAKERAVVSGNMGREHMKCREKGVIDSGCSRHMTGNKCYLTDFEAFDGGFVSFRDGKGRIFGKVVTGNQTNGIAGTKEKHVAHQDEKKKELKQECIPIPICTTNLLISQDAKDSAEDAGKKAPKVDASEASDNGGQDNQVSRSKDGSLFQQDRQTKHNNSTNDIHVVSSLLSTVGPSFVTTASQIPLDAAGPSANDTRIFGNAYDNDVIEEEVDINNVDSSYAILEATKFLKDHPQEQVIGSLETPV